MQDNSNRCQFKTMKVREIIHNNPVFMLVSSLASLRLSLGPSTCFAHCIWK
jgi:hypothetical protein